MARVRTTTFRKGDELGDRPTAELSEAPGISRHLGPRPDSS